MPSISTAGTQVILTASETLGAGALILNQFPDDADPLDIADRSIGDSAMGPNGDHITWSMATPTEITLSLIPGTQQWRSLNRIYAANITDSTAVSVEDVITLTRILPSGITLTAVDGIIISGPPGLSSAQGGRLKSVSYVFRFGSVREVA